MSLRLAVVTASFAVAASGLVVTAGAAHAQETSGFQANPMCNEASQYSPRTPQGTGQGVSDRTLERQQQARASSGCFTLPPGASVTVRIFNGNQSFPLANGTVGSNGNFSTDFTTPQCIANGSATVQFTSGNSTINLPVDVVGGSTSGCEGVLNARGEFVGSGNPGTTAPGQGGTPPGQNVTPPGRGRVVGVLPRTGTDTLVPLAIGGGVLVLVGAGVVVGARRRSTEFPGSPA